MTPKCPSCQHPMPEQARLCTRCGYDRIARTRAITQPEPPPPEPPPTPVSPWTGPTAVALGILAAFAVAAPLVWRHPVGTGVYAGAAVGAFVPLWFVQRSRARAYAWDPDGPDDPEAASLLEGAFRLAMDSPAGPTREQAEARALRRAMFSRETAGRVQSALLASMLAVLAAGLLAVAAYGGGGTP